MMPRRIGRYILVGGGCALTQNIALIGLVRIGIPYLAANIVATVAIVPIGYLLHTFFTFRVAPSLDRFARFVAVVLVGLPVSTAFLWLVHGICAVPIGAALIVVTGMMAVYGFALTSWISRSAKAPRQTRSSAKRCVTVTRPG